MIRASAGTWLNYGTTIIFQILFAAYFGTSASASAFVVAFAVAVSASGVAVTTALSIVLPRMLTHGGDLSKRAVRILTALTGAVAGVGVVLGVAATIGGAAAASVVGVTPGVARSLLLTAAVLLFALAVAGILGTVALARGHRFFPALAPALPSTAGVVYLATAGSPNVTATLLAMTGGAILQAGAVGVLALVPRPRVVETPHLRTRTLAIWTVFLFLLLSVLPPLQRVVATIIDSGGAAQYDYASRGLQVVQQLMLGGLVIAVLPDWTTIRRHARRLRREVVRATALATVLLFGAGAVALVASPPVVALVFERGAFNPQDSDAVVSLTRLLVPGFIAEGLLVVLSQAMLAMKRTRLFLTIGFARFSVHVLLTIGLGVTLGAIGVALAYSVSLAITAGVAAIAATRIGLFRDDGPLLIRSLVAGGATGAAGVVLMAMGEGAAWPATAAVIGVAVVSAYLLRLGGLLRIGADPGTRGVGV